MSERPGTPASPVPPTRPGGSSVRLPRIRAQDLAEEPAPGRPAPSAPKGRPSGIPVTGPASPQPLSRRAGSSPDALRRAAPDELIPGVTAGRKAALGLGRRRRNRTISTARWLAEWLVVLTVALLVAVGVKTYVFQAYSIPSASMSPTLEEGDRVLVSKLSTAFSDPDRGDVVVFRRPPTYRPGDPEAPTHLIKRVIGLPGERVSGAGGKVLIDGEPLDEPWLNDGVSTVVERPIKVQAGQLLVLGDNRGGSEDGRFFGTISPDLIEGRAVATIWPPNRLGGL
ncbi:MAG: signal peptidase I [Microthrixaceae bacterium]